MNSLKNAYVNVPPVDLKQMSYGIATQSSSAMRERVMRAREIQKNRFDQSRANASMNRNDIKNHANLTKDALTFLLRCSENSFISARSFDRIIRVARTIADLEESLVIEQHHIGEALHYRPPMTRGHV